MKTKSFPNCTRVTIEHEGGVETFEAQGSARVDMFENGVLEIRTFSNQPLAAKRPTAAR